MQSSHPIDFLRKFVRSRLNSNSMLWKNILYIKDLFQSIASHTLLLYDHLLFSFQRDRTKKTFGQSEHIHFATYCINLVRRSDKK